MPAPTTPTKKYNLRSQNTSPAQKKTPTKRSLPQSPKRSSKSSSPIKKQAKLHSLPLDLTELVPEKIIKFIEDREIDLQGCDVEKLFERDEDRSPADRLKEEIYLAWIQYLKAAAQEGKGKSAAWNKTILKSLSASKLALNASCSKSNSLDCLKCAPLRNDLIKQRASLRKSKGPQKKTIDYHDLKQARGKLIKLPLGQALKDKVSIPELAEIKGKLRPACTKS